MDSVSSTSSSSRSSGRIGSEAERKTAARAAEVAASYPSVAEGSTRPADMRIMCPFLRYLERTGALDGALGAAAGSATDEKRVSIVRLTSEANKLGLGALEGGLVATLVSAGQAVTGGIWNLWQNMGMVNLTALDEAKGVAHLDGFSFGPHDTALNPAQFAETLKVWKAKADVQGGRLTFQDIVDRKNEIGESIGVEPGAASLIENKLLFSYLGGAERGFIDYDDVVRFFLRGEVPKHVTSQNIDKAMTDNLG